MSTDNHDPVNHPKHYTSHASGIECIEVTEHMNFCRGNAGKANGIPTPNTIQSMGGKARNAVLSVERKSEIARKAALARWAKTAIPPKNSS